MLDDDGMCVMSLLPPGQCSHCRGLDRREAPAAAERTTEALYPSGCPSCAGPIRPGDIIGLVDGDWLCSRCAA